jgi:hypothetical protein
MNLTAFLSQISQLESLVLLVEKFVPYTGKNLNKDQWINLFQLDQEKALELLSESTASVLIALVNAIPTREELKGDKGDQGDSVKGDDGPSVNDVVLALKGELTKLAGQIQVPEARLQQIKSDLQAEIQSQVSKIKPTMSEKTIVEKPTIIEKTEVIYQKVEFDFVAQLLENKLSIKNALDLIEDEEDKLSITAVAGLPKELADLRKLIQNIKLDKVDYWGGGLDEGEVLAIVNRVVDTLPTGDVSFETVSKNLKAYPATLNYTGENLTSIEYDLGGGLSIIKTLNYTDGSLTSVVLSGDTPAGISLTKTLDYTGDNLSGVSYS